MDLATGCQELTFFYNTKFFLANQFLKNTPKDFALKICTIDKFYVNTANIMNECYLMSTEQMPKNKRNLTYKTY